MAMCTAPKDGHRDPNARMECPKCSPRPAARLTPAAKSLPPSAQRLGGRYEAAPDATIPSLFPGALSDFRAAPDVELDSPGSSPTMRLWARDFVAVDEYGHTVTATMRFNVSDDDDICVDRTVVISAQAPDGTDVSPRFVCTHSAGGMEDEQEAADVAGMMARNDRWASDFSSEDPYLPCDSDYLDDFYTEDESPKGFSAFTDLRSAKEVVAEVLGYAQINRLGVAHTNVAAIDRLREERGGSLVGVTQAQADLVMATRGNL